MMQPRGPALAGLQGCTSTNNLTMKGNTMKDTRNARAVAQHLFDVIFPAAVLGKLMTGGQQHPPMMVVELKNGKVETTSLRDKLGSAEEAMGFHAYLAQQPEIRAAVFVNEVWSAKLKDGDPRIEQIKAGKLKPQDVPGCGEAIFYDFRVGRERFVVSCEIEDGVPVPGPLVAGALVGSEVEAATA